MWLRWVVSNLLSQVAEDKVRQAVQRARHVVEPVVRRASESRGASAVEPEHVPTGPCDLVVLFALGMESGGLVDRMADVVSLQCATFMERAGSLDGRRLVVCESGVGEDAAAQATRDVIQVYRPRWIVSAGFAAALTPALRRGHIVMADSLVDLHHRVCEVGFHVDPAVVAATPSLHVGRLLTVDRLIRHRDEKEQLAADYGAIACDMETMAVSAACRKHRVRFLSVRIITDQMDDRLPAEVEHMLDQQSLAGKLGAATRALFQRPGSVQDLWKLRETAIRASDRLAGYLVGVLPQLDT